MGNVFKGPRALCTALFLCGAFACGSNENGGSASVVPPYQESLNPAPSAPGTGAESGMQPAAPTGTSPTSPGNETPAGPGTPLSPPSGMTGGTTPTAQEPAAMQPAPAMPPPPATEPPATARTQVFLLFGQSNMYGVPNPEQQDMTINPRVEVLTITSCAKHGVNQWVPAQPPLHGCVGQPGMGNSGTGPGVGPGDYFAKAIADAFPQDTILLVPAAVPGVSIDTFMPGQQNYTNLLNRAKMAQMRGEIRGMIFHQGESDNTQPTWPMRVKTVVDRLRSDLGVPNAPFVAGELWYGGCCAAHNTLVNQLPSVITNAAVAKADGLSGLPKSYDTFGNYHFDLPSQRTFGGRYAAAMLPMLQP